MKQKRLAQLLGISEAMVSKLARRGMPTTSLEAASRWRARNLSALRVDLRPAGDGGAAADPVEAVHALAHRAEVDFPSHAEALRRALRSVPAGARSGIELPMTVWRQLLPAGLGEAVPADPEGALAQTEDDSEAAGLALYALACHELKVNL